jgi:hypothetical protein
MPKIFLRFIHRNLRPVLAFCYLFALSACVDGNTQDKTEMQGNVKNNMQTKQPCRFESVQFPDKYRVIAASAYSGVKLPRPIDKSGHQATQINVVVNITDQPVALLLGAYEPTIWHISRTKNTKILAVLLSGYHKQVSTGLGKGIPELISTYQNNAACGYFDNVEKPEALDVISQRLFQRPVDQVFPIDSGRIVIGDAISAATPLFYNNDLTNEDFFLKNVPSAGIAGLEAAVKLGLLRIAVPEDSFAWHLAKNPDWQKPDSSEKIKMNKAYVVLKEFTYPAGLFGRNAATFFIPKGVPNPEGNPGHSAIFDFNRL